MRVPVLTDLLTRVQMEIWSRDTYEFNHGPSPRGWPVTAISGVQ
jgi:hypothetical protein